MLIKSNLLTFLFEGIKIYLLNIKKNQPATFHLLTPKIVVTIFRNTKISNIRATFNNEAKISYIILEMAIRLGLPITKS